ncbi:NAD-binding protein [Pseudonocardia benzenivorans]
MVTALAHRGIETHLIDPNPYALAAMADPDIMAPVEESWRELGVHLHFNTTLEAFLGDADGKVRAVRTSSGRSRSTWRSSPRTRPRTTPSPPRRGSSWGRRAASSSTST